jgi:hypothetical protein
MKSANSIVIQFPYVQEFRGQQEEVASTMYESPAFRTHRSRWRRGLSDKPHHNSMFDLQK